MVGPEGSFKGGRLSSRGTSAQQLDMCLSETSRCDYVVLSDLSTAPPLAGVRVSPWELCVPLVQVGGQLKACFYPCTGKDVCVSFFFFLNCRLWFQRHHRWRGVFGWTEDDFSLLRVGACPPSSEGDVLSHKTNCEDYRFAPLKMRSAAGLEWNPVYK